LAISICIPSIRQPTTSQQQKKSQTQNFYLLGKDFVYESTPKDDMEILFKQLKRLTKIAPVYFVYGNHENKIKFTRNKLNHKITKNNIIILNDQEVHLNKIILIGRSDYTNKKPKEYNLTTKTYNIVLDLQTQGTKENVKNNIDLQLSDHTHNGQMFPLSFSYHLQPDFAGNYGKETFKHHTKIISSGLVGWGFPIRTEGICEYVVVNITQDK
jgi:predicted MPP superfamily phosphohydrolase